MSNQIGTVEVIKLRGRAFNAKIDGEWYGLGFNAPKFAEGNQVEYEVTMNGAFKNAKVTKVLEATVSQSAKAPNVAPTAYQKGKDDTQKAIQYQASRNAAIAATGVLMAAGLVKLSGKPAKDADIVLAFIDEVTARYDQATTDHVSGVVAVTAEADDMEDPE